MVRFASPWMLALVPLGLAYVLWWQRNSFVNLSLLRRRLLLLLRLALVASISLALSRPFVRLPTDTMTTVLLIDVSDSISDAGLEAARLFAEQVLRGGSERVTVISFAGHARRLSTKPLRIERHDSDDTDYAEAIAVARAASPDGALRIVLLSDGNDLHGTGLAAIKRAAGEGVRFDRVRLPGAVPSDARLSDLRVPDVLRHQEPTRISALVESTRAGPAILRFQENDFLVAERSVTLKVGPQWIDFNFSPSIAGLVRYGAQVLMSRDSIPGNDRFVRIAQVGGPPHALLLSSTPEESMQLEEALGLQEINIESVPLGSLPSTLDGFLPYDEVIVVGIAPTEIDRARQSAIASYVRDTGGGLVFVAGPTGLKRDANGRVNALEAVLPIEMAAPSEKQEPPVAMMLLVDRSGSMVGEKLEFAKQAALAVIEKLSPQDQLGVIAFDAKYDWIVQLAPLEDKEKVKGTVGSLGAGGGTKFYPALEESYFSLGSSDAAVRHVILLTDGVSTDVNIFPELLEKMRASAITVSTVAIGHGADVKLLTEIAKQGGGRYSLAATAKDVPNIFVKETDTVQHVASQRGDIQPQVALSARELSGIDFHTAPPLSGYVRTKAKATTEVLLDTPRHDPLLVRWRYGLGQVVAFTSDATTRWASAWLTKKWPGYGKFWTQLVRGVRRTRSRRDLSLSLRMKEDRLALEVDAVDSEGRFLEELEVRARVIDGTQQAHEPVLRQVGPGRYVTSLPVPAGTVIARPFANRGGRHLEGDWTVLTRPYPLELTAIGDNEAFFKEMLEVGHGASFSSPDKMSEYARSAQTRMVALFLPLVFLALIFFLCDLMTKRARWELK